jgi:chromosome segregation ATPase
MLSTSGLEINRTMLKSRIFNLEAINKDLRDKIEFDSHGSDGSDAGDEDARAGLKSTKEELESQLQIANDEFTSLLAVQQDLRDQIDRTAPTQHGEWNIDELQDDLKARRQEVKNLKKEARDAREKQETKDVDLEKLRIDMEGKKRVIGGLEKRIGGLKKQIQGQKNQGLMDFERKKLLAEIEAKNGEIAD